MNIGKKISTHLSYIASTDKASVVAEHTINMRYSFYPTKEVDCFYGYGWSNALGWVTIGDVHNPDIEFQYQQNSFRTIKKV